MKERYVNPYDNANQYVNQYGEPVGAWDFGWVRTPTDVHKAAAELQEFAESLEAKELYAERLTSSTEMEKKRLAMMERAMHKEVEAAAQQSRALAEFEGQLHSLEDVLNDHKAKIKIANVDVIATIDEILLQLELEEDPKEILKYMRKRREELEPKW